MTAAPGVYGAADLGVDWSCVDAVRGPLGVAVSGGSDSTALAVLMAQHRRERVGAILTVNHGLRADAGDDVAAVQRLGAALGVPVHALHIPPGETPRGSVQAWARDWRHRLLSRCAGELGLGAVALGHTLDDQAETVLMRLGRGTGLRGLAAIRPVAEREGLVLLRPLLGCRRSALRAYLATRGIGWREDPSNAVEAFTRVAVRAALPRLSALGITPERLAATAAQLARASDAIDGWAGTLAAAAEWDRADCGRLMYAAYGAAPEEVRMRTLAALIVSAGGKPYGPPIEALQRADTALCEPGASLTLGRVRLVREGGAIVFWREARAIAPLTLSPGNSGIFDGRYRVSVAAEASEAVTVQAVGPRLSRALPQVGRRDAMATAPAIFAANRFRAAPSLGIWARDGRHSGVLVVALRHCAPAASPHC